ncbi:alpha/beta hydrolase [Bradyrhizobium betae]|uniref:Alpha/beta hydrolase n=1 Tax=Bradyrhizobium betae TaxID=244734 RepID=A0A4Q1VV81_9BRAD|nr:alpha/beta hydrolase [Bradyrhizobium betae]
MRSQFIVVDSIRTHYIEAGEGPPVLLLHSGEYGASGLLSWEHTIPALASRYRVLAPDWLGFGQTDKLYDFGGGAARRINHMARFIQAMAIDRAAFFGSSMGGTLLLTIAAARRADFPVSALVISSGGGFVPDNEARRSTLDYDGSLEGMRRLVSVITHDPKWADDEAYIRRRHAASVTPGAWEAIAAARFRSPLVSAAGDFGKPDATRYENIVVPVLMFAGANDALREPGYAENIKNRIRDARLVVFEECGHLPHIEKSEEFNAVSLEFLAQAYPST